MTRLEDNVLPHNLSATITKLNRLDNGDVTLWNTLVANDPHTANPFFSYAYALAAATAFCDVRVCQITKDGDPVGFFPFQYRNMLHRYFGIGMRVGGEFTDYFGLVSNSSLTLTPKILLQLARLNAFYFTHLDDSQKFRGLTGEKPEVGLRIKITNGGENYWSELRKTDGKFISDTERRERNVAKHLGPLHFVFRQEDCLKYLEVLIEKKREQYRRTGRADLFKSDSARKFLRTLALSRDPLCQGILSTLHAGETWIASHFGLMHKEVLHYWFPVYNPDYNLYAPGRLLMAAIIRSSDENGIGCIDRGAGESEAKRDFPAERHFFSRGLWRRRGAIGLAYGAGLSISWRIKSAGRLMRGEEVVKRSP